MDPHHFSANPDLAFNLNADPDPTYHFSADPDPDKGSILSVRGPPRLFILSL